MTPRLTQALANNLKTHLTLQQSAYERDALGSGIVHLGVGAFHRAHQAVYTDTVLDHQAGHWMITGASLRSASVEAQLQPQDGVYTVVERSNQSPRYRIIRSIKTIIVASSHGQQLIEAIAHPDCKIISLTITEKGYCHNPATGQLDEQHPDIRHDLLNPHSPKSAIGFIVAGLAKRQLHNQPISILSCDNLPANGQLSQRIVLAFAKLFDPSLRDWIDDHVSFPSSMVDRIVPATQIQDKQELTDTLGYQDEAMVCCEPFSQWVIEDNFIAGRPPWEKAGATFVDDVDSFEKMKLRLLNGSHSTMAYLGCLAGFVYVADVINDTTLANFVRYLMDKEITPTLNIPPAIDIDLYKAQLLERFANHSLQHACTQIAMDGSQKIPQRLLQPLQEQLEHGKCVDGLCLAVAAWMRYTQGIDPQGKPYTVNDPLAGKLSSCHKSSLGNSHSAVTALLALEDIFPESLANYEPLKHRISDYLEQINQLGCLQTVSAFLDTHE